MTYSLCAFATNCTSPERAEVEWTLASLGPDGEWYQWDGQHIVPFFTTPIDCPDIPIPDGWIDHIQVIAKRTMRKHAEPAFDLTAALGLHEAKVPAKPFARRI